MHAGFAGPAIPATKAPDYPQYAQFDVGGKKNEDALPEMPSWEGAESKKVLLEEEAVEMNALKKPEASGQTSGVMAASAAGIAMSPSSSRSPVNRTPYGPPGTGPGYLATGAADSDPYAQGAPGYNQPGMAYSQPDQGYGHAGAAMGPSRRSPRAYDDGGYSDGYNNGGYAQAAGYSAHGQAGHDGYGPGRQQPYDNYDNYGYGMSGHHQTAHEMDDTSSYPQDSRRSPAPQGSYGADSRRTPAPQGDYRRSPGPGADYGSRRSPAPQAAPGYDNRPAYGARGYSSESTRPLRAPPQRQYTGNSTSDAMSPISGPTPLQNNAVGGFDFTSGYSRPPALSGNGGYRQPSPGPGMSDQGAAYPGYKPYQPAT